MTPAAQRVLLVGGGDAHLEVLRRFALRKCRLPRHALALIGTGDRHAIASRGRLVAEGAWVWRWKERADRAFVSKYALPVDVQSLSADAQ